MSRPGEVRCYDNACVDGKFLLSPSAAVEPAFAAKAISMFGPVGSTLARPSRPRGSPPCASCLLENGFQAGVEDDEPQPPGGFERLQHPLQRQRLVLDVGVGSSWRRPGSDS